jgi:uncharacterized membrane protein YfcA
MIRAIGCPYFQRAFGWCVPIGGLSGLIGLGGGEFRLPVLMYAIGFNAKSAVPLNLAVSLITLSFALIVRSPIVPISAIVPHVPEVLGLACGGIASAFYGARLVGTLSMQRLAQIIGALLAAIGCLMLVEAVHPLGELQLLPGGAGPHFIVGVGVGLAVGLVSSILGVAGGELLIPVLIFIFGSDIKTAGSASIFISIAVVLSGLFQYWRMNAIPKGHGAKRIASAMSAGSIVGAALGGLAVAYAPAVFLKVILGCLLIATAVKTVGTKAL